ncbi:MAG: TPM domain-containing protein [Clostridia bacterium]|nr:TPM domain-containing protein [Clostridia bacterium]
MRKLFIVFILTFIFALAFAISVGASSYGVYDKIDALSTQEEAKIESALKDASEKTGISFYVGIGYYTDRINQFVSENMLYDSNMVVLLIENEYGTYYYQMHTRGTAIDEITINEENKLLDSSEVYDNIKSGNLADGVSNFAKKASYAYNTKNYTPFIIFCVIVTLAGSAIFVIVIVVRYKTKIRGSTYPLDKFTTLELTGQSDSFVTKNVIRVRVRSSSSKGGRSGGGGGGFRSSGRR